MLLHQIGWDSVMRMDANLRDLFLYEAFLYYNPLLLVVSWGLILLFMLNAVFMEILPDDFCSYFNRLLWSGFGG